MGAEVAKNKWTVVTGALLRSKTAVAGNPVVLVDLDRNDLLIRSVSPMIHCDTLLTV